MKLRLVKGTKEDPNVNRYFNSNNFKINKHDTCFNFKSCLFTVPKTAL